MIIGTTITATVKATITRLVVFLNKIIQSPRPIRSASRRFSSANAPEDQPEHNGRQRKFQLVHDIANRPEPEHQIDIEHAPWIE